ncbi:MAG TPA: flavin reductase family protein [Roseiflexaceae bacterium]|nr:flavin reductase family protein [Roseiflexaceae bacterium]
MPLDEARFRQTMGHFASGVTVVTTQHEGRMYGVTISSFASLSLQPPLILICLDKGSTSHEAIAASGAFVVNILDKRQEHLSRRFSSRDEDKFTGVAWQPGQLGIPVLDGALGVIECRLHNTLPGGDHTIYVGEVLHVDVADGSPLLYYRRGYHELK